MTKDDDVEVLQFQNPALFTLLHPQSHQKKNC